MKAYKAENIEEGVKARGFPEGATAHTRQVGVRCHTVYLRAILYVDSVNVRGRRAANKRRRMGRREMLRVC